jgi:hypothetical protein
MLTGTLLLAAAAVAANPGPVRLVRPQPQRTLSPSERQAIAFERAKAAAAARQAAIEAKHPTVFYNQVERQAAIDESHAPGNVLVPDTRPNRH